MASPLKGVLILETYQWNKNPDPIEDLKNSMESLQDCGLKIHTEVNLVDAQRWVASFSHYPNGWRWLKMIVEHVKELVKCNTSG